MSQSSSESGNMETYQEGAGSVLGALHKDAYQAILDGVKEGAKEKRLAAQFIPKFFKHFLELANFAINAQLDLCKGEDVSLIQSNSSGREYCSEQAIKFLSTKQKTLSEELMTKEVEEFILSESKKNKIKVAALKITDNINVLIKKNESCDLETFKLVE